MKIWFLKIWRMAWAEMASYLIFLKSIHSKNNFYNILKIARKTVRELAVVLEWFMSRNRKFFYGKTAVRNVGLSCLFYFASGQAYADGVCSGEPDDIAVAKCVGGQVRASSAELEKDYQEALTKLPAIDDYDDRGTKAQLTKAQAAWKVFVDEQCKLVGALQGGSSLFISIFESQCLWDENRKRMEFMKKIPNIE